MTWNFVFCGGFFPTTQTTWKNVTLPSLQSQPNRCSRHAPWKLHSRQTAAPSQSDARTKRQCSLSTNHRRRWAEIICVVTTEMMLRVIWFPVFVHWVNGVLSLGIRRLCWELKPWKRTGAYQRWYHPASEVSSYRRHAFFSNQHVLVVDARHVKDVNC